MEGEAQPGSFPGRTQEVTGRRTPLLQAGANQDVSLRGFGGLGSSKWDLVPWPSIQEIVSRHFSRKFSKNQPPLWATSWSAWRISSRWFLQVPVSRLPQLSHDVYDPHQKVPSIGTSLRGSGKVMQQDLPVYPCLFSATPSPQNKKRGSDCPKPQTRAYPQKVEPKVNGFDSGSCSCEI